MKKIISIKEEIVKSPRSDITNRSSRHRSSSVGDSYKEIPIISKSAPSKLESKIGNIIENNYYIKVKIGNDIISKYMLNKLSGK